MSDKNIRPVNSLQDTDASDELSLQELLSIFWESKWIIAGGAILALCIGVFYIWCATPVYKVDALVQVEEKSNTSSALFGELGELMEAASPAEAEIEIIKSRLTLGRVVEKLNLAITVQPDTLPVIGEALMRSRKSEIEKAAPMVTTLELPAAYLGRSLVMVNRDATGGLPGYTLIDDGTPIIEGAVGALVEKTLAGEPCRVFVSTFSAAPGERFLVGKSSLLGAIEGIKKNLSVEERGKKSGVLGLSYTDSDPARGVKILNEICTQYLMQNVERSSEEAEKTLAFLKEQMPQIKTQMEQAEVTLNAYRHRTGTVDLTQEATLMLDQGVSYETKIFELTQKKEELKRLFKPTHPAFKAIEAQIADLQQAAAKLDESVGTLPAKQQEVLRLSRNVQVNTELYTSLLNNAQQLQVAKAGKIGTVRIIDRSLIPSLPIKPKKPLLLALSLILGLMAGAGVALLRRLWDKGVEDPKVIEERLGLPVYATIPHSEAQVLLQKSIRRKAGGVHVLAHREKDDLAVESLRSLRTTLHFSMIDAGNNIIMLTGPCPEIGKSFVSINFAAVLALSGKKVLLIDGDMRNGHLNQYLGIHRLEGLSDALSGVRDIHQVIRETGVENLWMITTGMLPPNPSELLLHERFAESLDAVKGDFDYIVIDAPPVLAVTDAVIIGKLAGTSLLLLKHARHPMGEIETTVKRLAHAGVNLKGVVFNDVDLSQNRYGGRYGYRYGQYVYQYNYKKAKTG